MQAAHLVDVAVESRVERTMRVRQLETMFDCPAPEKMRLEWKGEVPFDAAPWSVGLIVGPSGSGKSTLARHLFGETPPLTWTDRAVVDDFDQALSMEDVSGACSAVGFNTIPAWMRPFGVLSNGERFRVEMARRLVETADGGTLCMDEFTSVVDRQVAQIGAHAVQKYVRRRGLRFVAATCHYDVVDWLQPDWVLEPATMTFQRRELQRRPALDVTVGRLPRAAWRIFAPYHYMSAHLHQSAKCYGLWVGERLTTLCAYLYRPHPRVRNIWAATRGVTLPDWQGLGLMFVLIDAVAAAAKARGIRVRHPPSHPSLVRAFDRSPRWRLDKRPGVHGDGRAAHAARASGRVGQIGGRPCAVFEYVGPAATTAEEIALW